MAAHSAAWAALRSLVVALIGLLALGAAFFGAVQMLMPSLPVADPATAGALIVFASLAGGDLAVGDRLGFSYRQSERAFAAERAGYDCLAIAPDARPRPGEAVLEISDLEKNGAPVLMRRATRPVRASAGACLLAVAAAAIAAAAIRRRRRA